MVQDRLKSWETLFRRALGIIDAAGKTVIRPGDWSFGGGTVLMRRYHHRFSKDIDIFVPDPQYLGHLSPRLNDEIGELAPRFIEQSEFVKFYFPEGEIDFIASAPLTRPPAVVETVLGSKVRVQTSAEIIARKLRFRGAEFAARDIFDFAVVAEREPGVMHRIAPILRECRETVLSRLLSGDTILRKTFAQLDALEYRRSYRECVAILKEALEIA
jgi:predicted nucleotidyltransferase component of viral defense system